MPALHTSTGSWSTPSGPLREPLLDAGASPPPRQQPMTVEVMARSFAWMEYRKMRRLLFGLYPEKQRIIVFWGVAYFLVLGVLAGLHASGWQPPGLRLHWDPNDVLLYTLFTCITLFTATKTGTDHAQIRFCMYWAYVAVMVLLVTDNLHVARPQPPGIPSSHELRRRLLVGLLALEALTLQTWWCLQNLLPSAVLWTISRVDLRLWWRIEPIETTAWPGGGGGAAAAEAEAGEAGEACERGVGAWEGGDDIGCHRFRYARRASGLRVGRGLTCVPPCGGSVHVCSYRGGVHPTTGRPHGYGEWVDDSYHGECLRGFWEDGVPRGPFCSREFGSGFAFVSTQLGYCCSHDDPTVAGTPWVRRRAAARLRFGVASVECSVSGQFFREFPHVQTHAAADDDPSAAEEPPFATEAANGAAVRGCLRTMRHVSDGAAAGGPPLSSPPPLPPPVAAAEGAAAAEAVLFIPGFNTSLHWALVRVGQMVAQARLPPHIKPFVFSWPGGWMGSYLAAKRAAASGWMAADVTALLRAMHGAGVRKVHLLGHSMGAMVLLEALPPLCEMLSEMEMELVRGGELTLLTVTLLSPDYPLDAFLRTSYPLLRRLRHPPLLTVYGDRHDKPLTYAEMVFGRRTLGRLWGAPWVETDDGTGAEAPPGTLGGGGSGVGGGGGGGAATADVELGGRVRWLALDVVDTTSMQAGLPAGNPEVALLGEVAVDTKQRHAHFAINQLMVDDLRELIVHCRSARERSGRLLRRTGNVYKLLVPPT